MELYQDYPLQQGPDKTSMYGPDIFPCYENRTELENGQAKANMRQQKSTLKTPIRPVRDDMVRDAPFSTLGPQTQWVYRHFRHTVASTTRKITAMRVPALGALSSSRHISGIYTRGWKGIQWKVDLEISCTKPQSKSHADGLKLTQSTPGQPNKHQQHCKRQLPR